MNGYIFHGDNFMNAEEANELMLKSLTHNIENGDLLETIHNIIKDRASKGYGSVRCVFICEDEIEIHWDMHRNLRENNKYENAFKQLTEEGYWVSSDMNRHCDGGDEYIYHISWDQLKQGYQDNDLQQGYNANGE
jgi:hypothetical protein